MRRLTSTGKNNPTGCHIYYVHHSIANETTLGQYNELSQQRSAPRMYTCTKNLARELTLWAISQMPREIHMGYPLDELGG